MRVPPSRNFVENAAVVALTVLVGIVVGAAGTSAPLVALLAGLLLGAMLVFLVVPDRRVLCLVAWVLIQPLSVEKILFTAAPIWAGLRGYEIVLNAADLILVVLAVVIALERQSEGRPRFVLDARGRLFGALVAWGIVSYLIHLSIYQDTFVATGPLGIVHLVRNFAFVVVLGSAIRTRADLVWLAFAALVIVLFESGIVFLSYATGQEYNFPRLLGITTVGLQKYSGDGQTLVRGSGTLGVANQQALFQVMYALLLVGLLAVTNQRVRVVAAVTIAASMFAIVLTFSRTAWLSTGCAVLLIGAIVVRRGEMPPRAWLAGALATTVLAAGLVAFAQPVIDRLTRGDDGATDSRLRMIDLAGDLIAHNPVIGVGPSAYAEAGLALFPPGSSAPVWLAPGEKPIVPPLGRIELAQASVQGVGSIAVPLSVHNKYLLTFAELGIVGLALWLGIFFTFVRDALTCSRASDPFLRYLGLGGIAICAVALIHMTLDLFSDDKTLQELLFPLIVVGAGARIVRERQQATITAARRPTSVARVPLQAGGAPV